MLTPETIALTGLACIGFLVYYGATSANYRQQSSKLEAIRLLGVCVGILCAVVAVGVGRAFVTAVVVVVLTRLLSQETGQGRVGGV